MIMISGAV